jgi:tetratricopeptide (TPR) repeat protein
MQGYVYLLARRYDEAIDQFQKTLALYPDSSIDHHNLGLCYENKGMYTKAAEEYLKGDEIEGATKQELDASRRAFSANGLRGYLQNELRGAIVDARNGYVPPFDLAELYARLGDKDHAFENLEKSYKEGAHNIAFLKVEPGLDNLRSDPRFARLLQRIGLQQ